jgi:phosphoesterase RecJ-like protein
VRKNFRDGRVGGEIQKVISELLRNELKDKRLSAMISITDVKATKDASFATVYFTVLGERVDHDAYEEEKKDVLEALNGAKGLIRGRICQELQLRHAPDLAFRVDESLEYGRHIESVIRDIHDKETMSFEKIADVLDEQETILLFPHKSPDGDALGSSCGLAFVLRELDKHVHVIVDESVPVALQFLDNGLILKSSDVSRHFQDGYDLAILIDNAEPTRLPDGAKELFSKASKTMCIDHHITSTPAYDYNLIDSTRAATAEIIYDILAEYVEEIPEKAAEAVYAGIVTDTGRFSYANTTPRTMEIACELLKLGVSPSDVSKRIYQSNSPAKLKIEGLVFDTIEYLYSNMCAIAYMTQDMMRSVGAIDEDTEGISEALRSVRGVELAIFLRETEEGKVKISMRSQDFFDASQLASHFGGGGHKRAAGFITSKPLEEIIALLKEQVSARIHER